MAEKFIQKSKFKESGFYLYNFDKLYTQLKYNQTKNIPTILWGVSFALMDFANQYPDNFSDITIIETGGMKGRREEISRPELHSFLCKQFNVKKIHSEYGMTELLSQAYSQGEGVFKCPLSIKILVRNLDNPLEVNQSGLGALNVIDLNNKYSCAFIATDDYGKVYTDGSFEVLGRISNAELRGCNQLI